MGDAGVSPFQGNLDPRAQEFIPGVQHHVPVQLQTMPYPNMYYPYQPHPQPFLTPSPPSFPAPPAYPSADPSSFLPPTTTATLRGASSRALLLSMVPSDVSESLLRRELEIFGDVRAVQMERIREGIVTVHFYDLRQAQEALAEIQEQHMQQQFRVRRHHDTVLAAHHHASLNLCLTLHSPYQQPLQLLPLPPPPPVPPPARGLIGGSAVWAQFTVPVTSSIPDGTNQGTIVIFNLDPEVSPIMLTQIFQAFGHVKELRETPRKRHQRFVEFYDTRDAATALMQMNGKEINGRQIVIEFSRPGGGQHRGNKNKCTFDMSATLKFSYATSNNPPTQSPPPPPPSLVRKTSGRWIQFSDHFDDKGDGFHHPKGNPNGKSSEFSRSSSNSSKGSLSNSMGSLRLGDGHEERCSKFGASSSNSKKNCKNSNGAKAANVHSSGSSSTRNPKQQHQHQKQQRSKCGSRPWKGSSRQSKEYDPRFLINEDATIEADSKDTRTTVMIKNIPNKYSQKLLLNMLDNHCIHCNEQIGDGDDQPLSSYDFVYLPIDFVNKCNVGYGFVNMTTPEATLRLYKAFHRQSWEVFNSRKICEVTYARLQGVEALKDHFKNSKFPYDIDEYMPVTFSPPRDGRQLTEPVCISCRSDIASPSNIIPYSSCNSSSPGGSSNSKEEDHYYYSEELNGHPNVSNHTIISDDGNEDGGNREDGGGRTFCSSSNGGMSGGECDDSDGVA